MIAKESMAPPFSALHNIYPATHSNPHVSRKPRRSGIVVYTPIFSNGPYPYVGKPITYAIRSLFHNVQIPYRHGTPNPRPENQVMIEVILIIFMADD